MSDEDRTIYYLIERDHFTGWGTDHAIHPTVGEPLEFATIKEARAAMRPGYDQRIVKITKEVVW